MEMARFTEPVDVFETMYEWIEAHSEKKRAVIE